MSMEQPQPESKEVEKSQNKPYTQNGETLTSTKVTCIHNGSEVFITQPIITNNAADTPGYAVIDGLNGKD